MMRVPVLLSTAAFLFEVARCSSEKYLKSFVIRNSDIYLGKALKDCCACDVFPKISSFLFFAQLEMEDEDTIDVFQQQTGGRCS